MRDFIRPKRDQLVMLETVDLRSAAPEGSAVDIIDKVVESMDTRRFEARYNLESAQGQNPIHPKTLLKVCLLAICNGRFTTRKMEEDSKYNLAYKYLTGCQSIDHSTFGGFINKNRAAITNVFSQTVDICKEKNLIDFKVLGIDSVKLRANASYKNQKNSKGLEKRRQKIRQRIEDLLNNVENENLDQTQRRELERLQKKQAKIMAAAGVLNQRLAEAARNATPEEAARLETEMNINITDHGTQIMQQANGQTNPNYSITTATNNCNDVITHFQVNPGDNDGEALIPAIEGSKNNVGQYHDHTLADSGFGTFDNLENLSDGRTNLLMPDRRLEAEQNCRTAKGNYDRSHFAYNSASDYYVCPQGQILPLKGEANNGQAKRYANPKACRQCLNRIQCTKSLCRVIIRDNREYLKETMRQKLSQAENQKCYNLRAHVAESPFGCVKWNWKIIALLRRGAEKVQADVALIFSVHNILKLRTVWYAA